MDVKPKTEGLSSELLSALATLKQYDTECKIPSRPNIYQRIVGKLDFCEGYAEDASLHDDIRVMAAIS